MTLMRFDPFPEWDRLAEEVLSGSRTPRTMPMEAFRRGQELLVALDLPGIDPADVAVTVERNVVDVRAARHPMRRTGDEIFVDERPQGEFTRQLLLGDNLDPGRLSANLDRGVLTLTIPVAETSQPRRIEVGGQVSTPQTIEAGQTPKTGARPETGQDRESGRGQPREAHV